MSPLFVLLQEMIVPVETVVEESYFSLLMKGGWILVPLFFLFFLAIAVIIERWLVINKAKNKDKIWISQLKEMINEKKWQKASKVYAKLDNSSAKVVLTGLEEIDNGIDEVEETMQIESRQEINRLEKHMSYLGITATIAPMLGFLGTIFGVIKIFYNISVTNDLNIATISDGLYQKMICSGVGLFVGIIAYTGYYLLNGKIDGVVAQVEKDSNEILKSIRQEKRQNNED